MSQVQNLITEHLDTWTQAIETKSSAGRGSSNKFTLVGIKKLRELILEMAVRGLLVPQDLNDEPASVLLEKITAEKTQLIKEKKIKKTEALPEITEDEKPFDLPSNWEWVRLPESYYSISPSGKKLKTSEILEDGEFPVVDQGQEFISGYFNDESLVIRVPKSVIIFGDHTTNLKLINFDFIAGADGTKILCPLAINAEYFYRYLTSLKLDNRGYGRHFRILNNNLIAIPPLHEQKRIVDKVDELMGLCDQLEQQTLDSIEAHQTLVEVLLNELVNPNNTANIHQAWSLIADNFDVLFTTEKSIDTLKQTILQLAVMGKLIPQNPNDEPASKLLKKIATEKAQLIKDGKIKKSKPLPEISEEEKPFDLPNGWEWSRIIDLAVIGTGATPSRGESSYFQPAEFNWVTSGETSQDYIYEATEKVSAKAISETNVSIYPIGTLIVAMYGQGKTRGQITELKVKAGTNQACAAIQLIKEEDSHREYIKNCFKKAYEEIRSGAAGGAQPNLNVGKISSTVLPLPPLNEQKSIVARVNELMTLCDQLKTNLQSAKATQCQIAESIVQEALN
ncbi:MAG: restriction endonuclease subunit S [Bacteroidales bacterium]|jgi:type I restriction enzyme S subunit|nr:restriction endonuclease subunit S [Bacteroidales bacterium]